MNRRMYYVSNATRHTKGDYMREALKKIIILPIAAGLLYFILFPEATFGAAAKIRHLLSVYSDNKGEDPVPLRQPEGVGCNENMFLVADSGNGRLLRYALKDEGITSAEEIKVPQLTYPLKVRINSKGDIYTLDGKQRRIVHIGPDGMFRGYVDPKGLPSPEEYVPKSFAIDTDDNIYILDIFSARVLVLTPSGEYLRQIKFPEKFGFFSDITVDFKDDILLLDSTNARIVSANKQATAFSPVTESLREVIRFPASFISDDRGRIFLVDRNGGMVVALGQDGSFLGQLSQRGWKEGLLNHPSQACLNTKGKLFIADTSNNRVQIFEMLR